MGRSVGFSCFSGQRWARQYVSDRSEDNPWQLRENVQVQQNLLWESKCCPADWELMRSNSARQKNLTRYRDTSVWWQKEFSSSEENPSINRPASKAKPRTECQWTEVTQFKVRPSQFQPIRSRQNHAAIVDQSTACIYLLSCKYYFSCSHPQKRLTLKALC